MSEPSQGPPAGPSSPTAQQGQPPVPPTLPSLSQLEDTGRLPRLTGQPLLPKHKPHATAQDAGMQAAKQMLERAGERVYGSSLHHGVSQPNLHHAPMYPSIVPQPSPAGYGYHHHFQRQHMPYTASAYPHHYDSMPHLYPQPMSFAPPTHAAKDPVGARPLRSASPPKGPLFPPGPANEVYFDGPLRTSHLPPAGGFYAAGEMVSHPPPEGGLALQAPSGHKRALPPHLYAAQASVTDQRYASGRGGWAPTSAYTPYPPKATGGAPQAPYGYRPPTSAEASTASLDRDPWRSAQQLPSTPPSLHDSGYITTRKGSLVNQSTPSLPRSHHAGSASSVARHRRASLTAGHPLPYGHGPALEEEHHFPSSSSGSLHARPYPVHPYHPLPHGDPLSASLSSSASSLPGGAMGRRTGLGSGQGIAMRSISRATKTTHVPALLVNWLKHHYGAVTDGRVARHHLYAHYLSFCDREGIMHPGNPSSFGKMLRRVFPHVRTRRLGTRGNSRYHYLEIMAQTEEARSFITEEHVGVPQDGRPLLDGCADRCASVASPTSSGPSTASSPEQRASPPLRSTRGERRRSASPMFAQKSRRMSTDSAYGEEDEEEEEEEDPMSQDEEDYVARRHMDHNEEVDEATMLELQRLSAGEEEAAAAA